MKPSQELFKLIKSLSKSEKRFFKLSSSLQSGEKNYIKLFDFMDKQDHYDEDALKQHFRKDRFVKHLPSEKNHLFKIILKSLRAFYGEQSVNSYLQQEIKNVEILFSKALYGECNKILRKAKKIAEENERFYYWFELLSWEKKLLEESYEEGNFDFNLDALIAEEENVIEKLRNLAEYSVLYSKINYVFRSGGFSRNETEKAIVDGIADYHLIKGKNTALSVRATSICYYIKGLCSATNRDYSESHVFFKRVISILDEHPKIKADLAKRYLMAHEHLTRCFLDSKDYQSAEAMIAKIKLCASSNGFQSIDMQVRIFAISAGYDLILLNAQGRYFEAIQHVENMQDEMLQFADKFNKEQKIIFAYHTAYAHFGFGQYRQAMRVLNELTNDNETMLRQDIYSFARVLNMLIHFELENESLLQYNINYSKRILSKEDKNYIIENYLIEAMQKLSRAGSLDQSKIFKKMDQEITEMMHNHKEKVILEYFDLERYIQSKLADKTMYELSIA